MLTKIFSPDSHKFGEKSKTLCEEVKTLMLQIFDSISAKESSLSDMEYYSKNEQSLYNLLKSMNLNVDAFKRSFGSLEELSKICLYYYEICSYFCTNFSDVLKGKIQYTVCKIVCLIALKFRNSSDAEI